jgi:predicted permease
MATPSQSAWSPSGGDDKGLRASQLGQAAVTWPSMVAATVSLTTLLSVASLLGWLYALT